MSRPQNKNEYRAELAESFAHVLEEKGLNWKKEWRGSGGGAPFNAITKARYRGCNSFWLSLVGMMKNYQDPRWVTMVQIMDNDKKYHPNEKWHLKKGSEATYVEYWYPYDLKQKKALTWDQYKHEISDGRKEEEFKLSTKYTAVFNASQVEGMPELVTEKNYDISPDELIKKLSEGMKVEILNDGGDRAYYSPREDRIHLPNPESFTGDYAYNSTALHELAHIHNHIIYNSTDISCSRKYRDFFRSGKALQKLSDLVCIENGLSVIEPKPYRERKKYKDPRFRPSMRDELRICIDSVFLKEPKSFEEFLKMLQENDYELKSGKHQAVRKKGGQKFIRFDSLGEKYTEENIRKAIEGGATDSWKTPELIGADLSLMVDIQKIISEKKGAGYEHWAKKFNLKQTAKVLCFLKENNIDSLSELKKLADSSSERFDELSATIKAKEKRIGEISDLKKHIFNYSKTRDTYEKYRKSGYSKKFYEANREELQLHKAAKEAFNALGLKKLPSVKELNEEFQTLVEEKRRAYGEYREAKEKMQAYAIARQNIEEILHSEEREKEQRKEIERIK